MNILGVIPARLESTRMPRKVLREIGGVPMVVYVFRRAQGCRLLSDLLVATDSDEVVEACHAHHVPAVLTSSAHRSGTDRVWEVSRARVADVYVNVQGDEPLVTTGHIESLVRPFLNEPEVQVTTLKIRATPEEVPTRTANKVVTNRHGDALYFSRLPIPCDRDERGSVTYVTATSPGNRCFTTGALTQPVDVIRLPQGLEPMAFQRQAVVRDCP